MVIVQPVFFALKHIFLHFLDNSQAQFVYLLLKLPFLQIILICVFGLAAIVGKLEHIRVAQISLLSVPVVELQEGQFAAPMEQARIADRFVLFLLRGSGRFPQVPRIYIHFLLFWQYGHQSSLALRFVRVKLFAAVGIPVNDPKFHSFCFLRYNIPHGARCHNAQCKQQNQPQQSMLSIEKKLQQAHRGYAYELLQLQMAVEDEKLACQPSIVEITKLIQLYMIGVEVLESIADPRFVFFHNKIHSLMLKKHIVKKLHEASGQGNSKQTITAVNKAQLKDKKDEYEINFYFNQGQVDIKKVKEMLTLAENKKTQIEGKINTDIKKQQDKLEQRLKERKMRSEAGSVKKFKLTAQKEVESPGPKRQTGKDPRFEYFDTPDHKFIDPLPRQKAVRTNSGSLQKIIFDRKYGLKKQTTVAIQKQDHNDAI